MCGRFAVTTDPALLARRIDALNEVPESAETGPNYNVAPTSPIMTVVGRHSAGTGEPARRLRLMRWGFIPPWANAGSDGAPPAGGPLLINARADRLTTSPAYRAAAERRRCLVPMDGYYEWRAGPGTGSKGRKTPFYIHGEGAPLFAAGVWSVWRPDRQSEAVCSVAIITTAAVAELAEIHHRMPLLVPEDRWDRWLDPDKPADTALLAGSPGIEGITVREVSTLVNSVRNNSPQLIEPVMPVPEQGQLL